MGWKLAPPPLHPSLCLLEPPSLESQPLSHLQDELEVLEELGADRAAGS